jgi:aldehyde dehydrogenase (NAD+)
MPQFDAPIVIKNYINGAWTATGTHGTAENRNPADQDDLVGNYPVAGAEEVEAAVAAAKAAFAKWRLVPAPRRAEVVRKAGDLLARDKDALARLMTREMGKPTFETGGDAQEGIDTAYYCAGEGRRLFGDTVPCELPNKFGMSVRVPVGVAGIITPWNFPMAIPTWNIFPALVAGNACILKPSPETPGTAMRLVEILLEAGLPENVVQTISGGIEAGEALVRHPGVGVISFTGSSATGKKIAEEAGRGLKRLAMEMGGKNAMIVMDDADLELALEGALWGAFGTTGQRCTATSRLILHEDIHDEFVAELKKRASALRIGNGLDKATQMGPLVNAIQREKVASYVKIGLEEDRAHLELGGKIPTGDAYARGFFFEPTIFTGVKPNSRIAQEEIFGPVVSCIKISSFEEAIDVMNGTVYGLSSSIYTRDVNRAFQAIRDIEAGITYVNGPTIGAEVQLPFGGVKNTGNGHREAGHAVLDIYTEWKSVYIDYSGRLQKAQIDA